MEQENISSKRIDVAGCIDSWGNWIFQEWLKLHKVKWGLLNKNSQETFNLDNFNSLLKSTYKYFQQLNNIVSLPMYSKDKISYHSCMRVVDVMHYYSNNKICDIDVDYNDYDDLVNYPFEQLQVTIKATQLITESLTFAISLIPSYKLTETIGVIYNGTTTDYNIEKNNIHDIIKLVAEFPFE